ncbi:MAG: GldG family protein, partial [Gemmatimonadaceae bacterium]
IYFLSLGGVFLALAYGTLSARRLSPSGAQARRLRLGVAIIVAGVVVVNLAGGYITGRLDLTPGKAYTLSKATKQIVGSLDDIVTIKVFASDELPAQVSLMKRQLDDLLRDLRSASHGKVRVVRLDPATNAGAKTDAQALGIEPVQFNVIGQAELSVKEGYLGLAVLYGGANETIPFVNRGDDLEYRLVAAIRGLTHPKKPQLGVVAAAADPSEQGDGLEVFHDELGKSYDVKNISLSDSTQPSADIHTIVFAGPPEGIPPGAAERIAAFFRRGGSALVLGGGMELSPQAPTALPRDLGWNQILKPFGVSVKPDLVYDLASSDVVPVGTSFGARVLQRYPFFVRAQSTGNSVVNADVPDVLMPWPSSIDTTHSAAWTITPLLVTSRGSGSVSGPTSIEPTRDFPQTGLSPRLVAVQVAPAASSKDTTAHGRVIVVASSEMARSGFADRVQQNASFVLNAIDWLAQDESLISIRAKNTQPPALAFPTEGLREAVKYANMIGVPAFVALFGLIHLTRRRNRSRDAQRQPAAPREEVLA